MSDNICIHHTDAERYAWRTGCPICLGRQLAAVTAERDEISLRREESVMLNEQMLSDLSASQQEAQRLREALDAITASAKVAYCATTDPMMTDALVGIGKRCADATSATPAPVHSDTERLNFCDTMIDLEPGFYVLRFPVTESCTIRDAIDAELARND